MTPCQLQFYSIAILPYSFIFVNDELGLLIYVVPIMTQLLDIDIGVMYAFIGSQATILWMSWAFIIQNTNIN
jgi:hypothetical protein